MVLSTKPVISNMPKTSWCASLIHKRNTSSSKPRYTMKRHPSSRLSWSTHINEALASSRLKGNCLLGKQWSKWDKGTSCDLGTRCSRGSRQYSSFSAHHSPSTQWSIVRTPHLFQSKDCIPWMKWRHSKPSATLEAKDPDTITPKTTHNGLKPTVGTRFFYPSPQLTLPNKRDQLTEKTINTHHSFWPAPFHFILLGLITQRSAEMTPQTTQNRIVATTPKPVTHTRDKSHKRNFWVHTWMLRQQVLREWITLCQIHKRAWAKLSLLTSWQLHRFQKSVVNRQTHVQTVGYISKPMPVQSEMPPELTSPVCPHPDVSMTNTTEEIHQLTAFRPRHKWRENRM